CDLSESILEKANLSKAFLSRSNLKNVTFKDANLEGADLRGAIFDPEEIKKAKNWDKAIYDDEMKKILGLE
ncbi:MAG TPA: pentapeptide repeat-containing protein, partial [Aquifex sp.]|nr:pentapeptide repeat-containing protein [Aquifex sp.]